MATEHSSMRRILRTSACCLFGVSLFVAPTWAGDRNKDRDKNQDKAVKPALAASERVEQLLHVLKTDRKDDRRRQAAEELGKLASPEYPEVVSGLIDALVRDDSMSVRKAVVKVLADIEPPTHEVKDA